MQISYSLSPPSLPFPYLPLSTVTVAYIYPTPTELNCKSVLSCFARDKREEREASTSRYFPKDNSLTHSLTRTHSHPLIFTFKLGLVNGILKAYFMHPYCLRAECILPLPDGIIHCIGTTVQEIVGGQSQRLCLAFVSLNSSKYNYAANM